MFGVVTPNNKLQGRYTEYKLNACYLQGEQVLTFSLCISEYVFINRIQQVVKVELPSATN